MNVQFFREHIIKLSSGAGHVVTSAHVTLLHDTSQLFSS